MTRKIIAQRKRIYLAVEGEGEQSFVKFLQQLSDQKNIHIHLDCEVLSGGGYKTMLERAVIYRSRREKIKGKAKISILVVDTDRAENNDDGWSLEQLLLEAKKHNFDTWLQKPNLEGVLLRMLSQDEPPPSTAYSAHNQVLRKWSSYKKPADTRTLMNKFSYDHLVRAARSDEHLNNFLNKIGLLVK